MKARMLYLKWRLISTRDAMFRDVAWLLPRRLVYWSAIRLMAHATTGPHEKQVVPDLLAVDALKRWDLAR